MATKSNKKVIKYIFVMWGVMSGVWKWITCASIWRILISKWFNVSAIKIDPYINVDAGTMNPVEHWEVFVTEDWDETDQDVGNYERFLNTNIYKENYMTTWRVYLSVIQKERNLEYKWKCVEVVPHIPQEVIDRIKKATEKTNADFMLIEIWGTVWEYQNLLFLEAARMMKFYHPDDVLFVMVSYLPIPGVIWEMKSKPTQYAVRTLNSAGIQPDLIIARSKVWVDKPRREKIAINCSMRAEDIISAPDIASIYDVPINFELDKIWEKILKKLKIRARKNDMGEWLKFVDSYNKAKKEVNIWIVGKYFTSWDFTLADSYISVIEAIKHGAAANKCKVKLNWLNTDDVEKNGTKYLKNYDGIIVPQGWWSRWSEWKIKTIEYCRKNKVPYFGLCYGMQMAVIEFARNVCWIKKANSEECDPNTPDPVIHIMQEQKNLIEKKQYWGTIRLGGWPCKVIEWTHLYKAYKQKFKKENMIVSERHRHRYEFNNNYKDLFEKKWLVVAGTSPDGKIVEAIEIKNHPFFIGTQFHPEYISRPLDPHPLFVEFVKVCLSLKK